LSHIAINQGDLEAAQSYLDESLQIAKELGCKIGFVEALGDLGLVSYLRWDYDTARSYLEDSLKRFQEANLLPGLVSALNRLGDLARCQGDYEKANQLYKESLSLYRDMGDLDEIPSMLHNLGYTAKRRNELQQALTYFRQALSIQSNTNNGAGIAECLMGIAGVFTERGQADIGARLLGAAEALRVTVGATRWPANCLEYDCIVARLQEALDEREFAVAWAEGQSMTLEQAIAVSSIGEH
jgi:tetratricopeptide (TPR) repeat protein